MLRSMTAFGQSTLDTSQGEYLCEIRSVNHRYLDISVRLPDELRSLEARVRESITKSVRRGKLDVTVKFSEAVQAGQSLTVDTDLLTQLVKTAAQTHSEIERVSGSSLDIDPVRLMQWPGVVAGDTGSQSLRVEDAVTVFDAALQDYADTRVREGEQMASVLKDKSEQLSLLAQQVRTHRPGVVARQRDKLMARLATLDVDYEPARLEQELVFVAQKLDVIEELDRLDAHVVELNLVLARDEPVGRRLDFLMQEFNREANTLSSKSADSQTTAWAVDMKVLIEQMREQVQNVE